MQAISFLQFETAGLRVRVLAGPLEAVDTCPVLVGEGWTVAVHPFPQGATVVPLLYAPEEPPPARPVQFLEQTRYRVQVEGKIPRARFDLRLNAQSGQFHSEAAPEATTFAGSLTWGDFVGWSTLEVCLDEDTCGQLPVEVRARKLDYRTHYRQMLDDLAEQTAALLADLHSPTALPWGRSRPDRRSAYLDYLWLRHLFAPQRLPRYLAALVRRPQRCLVRQQEWRDAAQVTTIGPTTLERLAVQAEQLVPSPVAVPLTARLRGRLPRRLWVEQTEVTTNTPANRFVVYFLCLLLQCTEEVATALAAAGEKEWAEECAAWQRNLAPFLASRMFAELPPAPPKPEMWPLLARQDGYRELATAYRELCWVGRVDWEGPAFTVGCREVARLYEWWCFFQLLAALRRRFGRPVTACDFVELAEDRLRLRLRPGASVTLGNDDIRLFYQRTYAPGRGSYSVPLRPDFTLKVGERSILVDAKYRLEPAAAFSPEVEDSFVREDLYKMHTYRDAVAGAQAAFILYPGHELCLLAVSGEPVEPGPNFAGVGAIPLRPEPEGTELLERVIWG
ncbi:MAG TPA: DUF2357 domain-containing protein [Armatimonadetes bacterium]|nr:DUF2357 domain-containing protein [Armatimonadota bacterium]